MRRPTTPALSGSGQLLASPSPLLLIGGWRSRDGLFGWDFFHSYRPCAQRVAAYARLCLRRELQHAVFDFEGQNTLDRQIDACLADPTAGDGILEGIQHVLHPLNTVGA